MTEVSTDHADADDAVCAVIVTGAGTRTFHTPAALLPAALALAHELTAHSAPVSVALTRPMMWRMLDAAHPMESHCLDNRRVWARGARADAREGVQAFIDKREASFPDRVSEAWPRYAAWVADSTWDQSI